jgi:hypothetical protein
MRFWKKAASRAPTLATQRHDNEQRIVAETRARLTRNKVAFYATIARMDHDAAAPAVGKTTPSDRRTRV